MSNDPMVEEFFAELNDKYYPQVVLGLELLDNNQMQDAVETLSRPLHTIKGVAGFMAGFEEGSLFTHKVEDFLKAMQAGTIPDSEENLGLAARAVNMVFQVLEQLRDQGTLDQDETNEVLQLLLDAAPGDKISFKEASKCFVTEEHDGVTVISGRCRRIHTKAQRLQLNDCLALLPDKTCTFLDFSKVLTCDSSTWEGIMPHAERLDLSVGGLTAPCQSVFISWGFDKAIATHTDRELFFNAKTKQTNDS